MVWSSLDYRARMVGLGNAMEDTLNTCTKTESIRSSNDNLRRRYEGRWVVLTSGIKALGPELIRRIFAAVAAFDEFNEDNDPYGEYDCATMTLEDIKFIWKIDYYDPSRTYASEDRSNPECTARVLTVILAEEY